MTNGKGGRGSPPVYIDFDADDETTGSEAPPANPGDGGDNPPPRRNRDGGKITKRDWAIAAAVLLVMVLIANDWVDWRIGFAFFIPVLMVLIVGVGVLAVLAMGGGGHRDSHGDDSHGGGHGEEGGGHGHGSFLTRTPFFGVKLLGPDQEVIWVNRLFAKRGHQARHGADPDKGWITNGPRFGRIAFGLPLILEPEWLVDMRSKERMFHLTANPGGEAMKVHLRVVAGVTQDDLGHITPETARRLVTELDREPWAAIEDRAQSTLNDSLARLGFQSSLQIVPSPGNEGVIENYNRIEQVLCDPQTGQGILQEELRNIGFSVVAVQIQSTHSAAAEQAQEAHVRSGAGINPNVGLVVDAVKELTAAFAGRGKGGGGKRKSPGGRGGGGSSHGHDDDED